MSLEIWIAFALASTALLAVPGPTVMLVVSYALGRGRSTAWATVPGVTLGDFTAMTISLLGAGAIIAASPPPPPPPPPPPRSPCTTPFRSRCSARVPSSPHRRPCSRF